MLTINSLKQGSGQTGQIQFATCFCKYRFIGIEILPLSVYCLWCFCAETGRAAAETLWPKMKIT